MQRCTGLWCKKLLLCIPRKTLGKYVREYASSNTVIIAKNGKQPKCLLTLERINKLWNFSAMEDYTTMKMNELPLQGPSPIHSKNNVANLVEYLQYDSICTVSEN